MDFNNPKIVTVLISGGVSIVTVLLGFVLKACFERHFLLFKLESEHRYEQKKKIKEVLARYKTQLLDAGETLNHRLWNFSGNYDEEWHGTQKAGDFANHYYLASFVYRMLAFFAWVRQIESDMVHLDTTIASKDDLNFVKFLRLFTQTQCDLELFKGIKYDKAYAKDHFFHNNFQHMCDRLLDGGKVISFAEFKGNKNSAREEASPMVNFLAGMNPKESRLRWDRLQAFHFVLLMFMNCYGYDFQYTTKEKITDLLSFQSRPNQVVNNLGTMISRIRLDQQKEVKQVLETLNKSMVTPINA